MELLLLLLVLLLLRLHLPLLILLPLDPHLTCLHFTPLLCCSQSSIALLVLQSPPLTPAKVLLLLQGSFTLLQPLQFPPSSLLNSPPATSQSPNPPILLPSISIPLPFPPLPLFSPPHPLSQMIVQTSQNTPNTHRGTQGQFLPPLLGIRCPPLPGPRLLPLIETPSLPPPSPPPPPACPPVSYLPRPGKVRA